MGQLRSFEMGRGEEVPRQCLDGLQLTLLLKQDRGREPTEQGGGGGSFELV